MSMNDEKNIIKLRGLPWNSTAKDIIDFLKECQTLEGEKSVHMAISHRDGRPNGEAFVELASPGDVDKAFEYNKNVLGHRYIEIFNAKPEEFEMCLKRQNLVQQDTFIKLRGLPFSCKVEDIEQFFQGLEIRNGGNGIYIVYDNRGRPTGEAFVQFSNSEDTDLAMKKNREKIGQRYIEIFRSSSSECRRSTIFNNGGGGNGPRNGGGGGGLGGGFNNDRGMGRGQRNNRTNFRDRPYPDTPWSGGSNNNNNNSSNNNDAPWRNNNRGNFGGNSGGFNDNFSGGGNNNFNNDNNSNFSSDFERNWNSGGNNSFSSFGGANNNMNKGGGNGNPFNRDSFGFGGNSNSSNNFGGGSNNNSNMGGGNFGGNSDRFMGNNNSMNNGGSQYAVHLRGMPYDCGEDDVQQFFTPLKLVNVEILYNNNGRHTGEADAYFSNIADAQEAMKKHKEKMGSRYIELFAKSNDQRRGGGNGGGNGRF